MTDKIVSHTPGPWHRDQYGNLLDANGRSVLFRSVSIAASGSMVAEAEKNTDLIAVTPELLAALQDIKTRIGSSDHWWMDMPDRGGFDLEKIDAIIARATGVQP